MRNAFSCRNHFRAVCSTLGCLFVLQKCLHSGRNKVPRCDHNSFCSGNSSKKSFMRPSTAKMIDSINSRALNGCTMFCTKPSAFLQQVSQWDFSPSPSLSIVLLFLTLSLYPSLSHSLVHSYYLSLFLSLSFSLSLSLSLSLFVCFRKSKSDPDDKLNPILHL